MNDKIRVTNTYNAFKQYCKYNNITVNINNMILLNERFRKEFEEIYFPSEGHVVVRKIELKINEGLCIESVTKDQFKYYIIRSDNLAIVYKYVKYIWVDYSNYDDFYEISNYENIVGTINITCNEKTMKTPIINTYDMFIKYCEANNLNLKHIVNNQLEREFSNILIGINKTKIKDHGGKMFTYIYVENAFIVLIDYGE